MSLTWTVKQQTYRQKVVAFNAFKVRKRAVTVYPVEQFDFGHKEKYDAIQNNFYKYT